MPVAVFGDTISTHKFEGEENPDFKWSWNPEKINHPVHYVRHPSGIECIEITRHMNFNLGNAIKYIWRADLKNDALEDLKKAIWYIQDEIQRREKERG